jgi:5-deoxy-glucuronate isomerase
VSEPPVSQAHHIPAGTTGEGQLAVRITPELAGWGYSGLDVVELPPGASYQQEPGENETVVLPLAGSCVIDSDAGGAELAGRRDVFASVTDCCYVPRDAGLRISSEAGGRFALAYARARSTCPFIHIKKQDVRVELRGAGSCSRQVNNFGTPDVLEASRLIACEVLTPAGNWSSYPPHKHDTERRGESVLEEIYYFEVAEGPAGPGLAYQRVYGDSSCDLLAEVRTGDVVTIPRGWHGPSMAVPGYDLYYLNVMAGPGKRVWLISDDPAHSWVREQWAGQAVDPRLPMTGRS